MKRICDIRNYVTPSGSSAMISYTSPGEERDMVRLDRVLDDEVKRYVVDLPRGQARDTTKTVGMLAILTPKEFKLLEAQQQSGATK